MSFVLKDDLRNYICKKHGLEHPQVFAWMDPILLKKLGRNCGPLFKRYEICIDTKILKKYI